MKTRNKNIVQPEIINQAIINSLGLSGLTKIQQNKIVSLFAEIISSKINVAVWHKLSPENKNELKSLRGKKKLDYIASDIKDFSKLVEDVTRETIRDFKQKRMSTNA